ncbi:MAG: Glycosyl hydrolase family 57 [Methanocella sp. PtaU1.Bin125]|nr:MAG: Glycosyl hydrolase family 57 [Methanocella sp. PtaU1.Bin125]
MGFEVHQPYRLNPAFEPGKVRRGRKHEEAYFSDSNKEILLRVCDKCYIPATQLMLELLDDGFKCAYSLSGTLVEQLERWSPDTLDLFRQVARHRNAEMLSQTYYHSVASLFDDDLAEFEAQVRLHQRLMKDAFGVETQVVENTEFIFNNAIAGSVARMGFRAAYTEGVDRILGWRSPNYVYSCRGMKVLMRNFPLSDDIAFRFPNRSWSEWPLTADKYSSWIARSQGDYVNVFVDYETFGEHQWADTGIMEFLRWLPRECVDRGVAFATPSEIAELEPKGELRFDETVSWADVEKDVSAWLGNTIQHTALKAVQRARPFAQDKKIWRYLQTSDHFYYMASKFGSCGEVHSYFSPDACTNIEAFDGYMRVLADFTARSARKMRPRDVAVELRCLPPEKAFRFRNPVVYTGFTAYSLDDFGEMLNYVPSDSVAYHIKRGDFARWIRDVLKDDSLADEVSECQNRIELIEVVDRKRKELRRRLK